MIRFFSWLLAKLFGPWDYFKDETGNIKNPLPCGAVEGEFDIVVTANGKYVLASSYYELRLAEYPSIGDQLDSLFKAGVFPKDMEMRIAEVKAKYPKSL